MNLTATTTIRRPPSEVYAFWRRFEHLATFMAHLDEVRSTGDGRSHWTTTAPFGRTVEWDAETEEDVPEEKIGWRSVAGADVPNRGKVIFGYSHLTGGFAGGQSEYARVPFADVNPLKIESDLSDEPRSTLYTTAADGSNEARSTPPASSATGYPWESGPDGYAIFKNNQDNCEKVVLKPRTVTA